MAALELGVSQPWAGSQAGVCAHATQASSVSSHRTEAFQVSQSSALMYIIRLPFRPKTAFGDSSFVLTGSAEVVQPAGQNIVPHIACILVALYEAEAKTHP